MKSLRDSVPVVAVLFAAFASAIPALAGPDAGGVLIVHDTGRRYSATLQGGWPDICRQYSIPSRCQDAVTEIDNSHAHFGDGEVFRVYASFPEGSSPRLMGLTWGVDYDPDILSNEAWGMCGDFELNDTCWPGPGTGSSVVFNVPQTSLLTPV
jgi:hypothetical protein